LSPRDNLSRDPVTKSEISTYEQLVETIAPVRDDAVLAIAYRGLNHLPATDLPPVAKQLTIGTQQTYIIPNYQSNTNTKIEARLLAIGEHAYFWFDTTPGIREPKTQELALQLTTFDTNQPVVERLMLNDNQIFTLFNIHQLNKGSNGRF